jgi:rSAM/selenodomain-associated transferase 1
MREWLGKDICFTRQDGNGLGERMLHAFEQTWQQGVNRVLLIGSDCPAITASIIHQGLDQLCTHDLVLGPAVDGGYYLVGLRANAQRYELLFKNIDWGTGQVLQQTLHQAEQAGLSSTLLPTLHDIDRPEDLVHFDYHPDPE